MVKEVDKADDDTTVIDGDVEQVDRGDDLSAEEKAALDVAAGKKPADGEMSDDEFNAALENLKTGKTSETDDEKADDKKAESEDDKPADDKVDDEKKVDDTDDKKDYLIPKARFDEALGRKDDQIDDLTRRLAALEASTDKPADEADDPVIKLLAEISENEDAYEDALLDNDKGKAQTIRKLMNEQRDELIQLRITTATQVARAGSSDDAKYDTYLELLQTQHSVLDVASDDFDQTKVTEMVEMRDVYIAAGKSQFEALKIASTYVLGPVVAKKTVDEKADDEPGPTKAEKEAEDRKVEARKKAAKAVNDTPADLEGGGGPAPISTIDVGKLSQEQFGKLPDDALEKLRGDAVTP